MFMAEENKIKGVAVVNCSSYNQKQVDKAVADTLNLLNFEIKKNCNVLIKPNVVGSFPKKQIATTTHSSVVEAICKILKKHNCKITIGDSPFTNPEASFKASGLDQIAKKYGKLLIFEQDKFININDKKAKILKKFKLAKTVKKVDLIINMPKLKTHVFTKYTGAIKNHYGFILGGMKQRTHLKAKGDKKFSNVLVDIYQNIKPELNIMDAVIGMEGEGPTSGTPKKVGLIIASKNSVALDIAATKIIGLNPKRVYMIKEAVKRKLYPDYKFNLLGMKTLPKIKFKMPPKTKRIGAQAMINKISKEKPIVLNKNLCVKCGTCAKHCPGKAIKLAPYPEVDRKKCIRCFCCIEICPHDALSLRN